MAVVYNQDNMPSQSFSSGQRIFAIGFLFFVFILQAIIISFFNNFSTIFFWHHVHGTIAFFIVILISLYLPLVESRGWKIFTGVIYWLLLILNTLLFWRAWGGDYGFPEEWRWSYFGMIYLLILTVFLLNKSRRLDKKRLFYLAIIASSLLMIFNGWFTVANVFIQPILDHLSNSDFRYHYYRTNRIKEGDCRKLLFSTNPLLYNRCNLYYQENIQRSEPPLGYGSDSKAGYVPLRKSCNELAGDDPSCHRGYFCSVTNPPQFQIQTKFSRARCILDSKFFPKYCDLAKHGRRDDDCDSESSCLFFEDIKQSRCVLNQYLIMEH